MRFYLGSDARRDDRGVEQHNSGAFPGPTFCFQCHDEETNTVTLNDSVDTADPGDLPADAAK